MDYLIVFSISPFIGSGGDLAFSDLPLLVGDQIGQGLEEFVVQVILFHEFSCCFGWIRPHACNDCLPRASNIHVDLELFV